MSGLGTVNAADWLKGLIMAAITAALTTIQQFVTNGIDSINWKVVGGTALAAAVAYIIKNISTDETGKVMGISATAGPPPAKG